MTGRVLPSGSPGTTRDLRLEVLRRSVQEQLLCGHKFVALHKGWHRAPSIIQSVQVHFPFSVRCLHILKGQFLCASETVGTEEIPVE